MAINLSGRGMCETCINGFHRKPGEPASARVAKGQTTLCECPCHLPKKLLAPKPVKRAPKPEQMRIDAPAIFLGGKDS